MTKITITDNQKDMTIALYAVGHAGYADIGQDIVCASVSILLYTFAQVCVSMRERGADVVCDLTPGKAVVVAKFDQPQAYEYGAVALQVVEVGYRLLAKQYPDHVWVDANRSSCGEERLVL